MIQKKRNVKEQSNVIAKLNISLSGKKSSIIPNCLQYQATNIPTLS